MEGSLHKVIEIFLLDEVIEMGWDAKRELKHLDVIDEGFGSLMGLRFWMDDFDEFGQIHKLFVGLFAISLKDIREKNGISKAMWDVIFATDRMGQGVDISDV